MQDHFRKLLYKASGKVEQKDGVGALDHSPLQISDMAPRCLDARTARKQKTCQISGGPAVEPDVGFLRSFRELAARFRFHRPRKGGSV